MNHLTTNLYTFESYNDNFSFLNPYYHDSLDMLRLKSIILFDISYMDFFYFYMVSLANIDYEQIGKPIFFDIKDLMDTFSFDNVYAYHLYKKKIKQVFKFFLCV